MSGLEIPRLRERIRIPLSNLLRYRAALKERDTVGTPSYRIRQVSRGDRLGCLDGFPRRQMAAATPLSLKRNPRGRARPAVPTTQKLTSPKPSYFCEDAFPSKVFALHRHSSRYPSYHAAESVSSHASGIRRRYSPLNYKRSLFALHRLSPI